MTEINRHPPGTFCWIDLAVTNAEEAKKFYAGLFGWHAHEIPVGPGVFTMLELDGKEVASLYQLSEQQQAQGVPAHWMPYVAVTSVDGMAERVRSLGGQILVEPFDVLDLGRMALILDPTGAPLALWQAGRHIGTRLVDRLGTLAWTELITNDLAGAAQFYTQLFGWEIEAQDGELTFFNRGRKIAGMRPMTKEGGNLWPQWLVTFAVADCEVAVETIEGLGGKVVKSSTHNLAIGCTITVKDSQGATFAIINHPH